MSKNLFLIGAWLLIAAYMAGRYSAPERVKIETVTVTKEVVIQDESKRVDQVQRVIETTYPDGRAVKETRTKTRKESDKNVVAASISKRDEKKEIQNRSGVGISVIAGLPLTEIARGPVYGAALAIPIIGAFFIGPVVLFPPNLFLGVQGGLRF